MKNTIIKIICVLMVLLILTSCNKQVEKLPQEPIQTSESDVLLVNELEEPISASPVTVPFDTAKLHGFNLLSKTLMGEWTSDDAQEWAFQFMQEYGFNFARIPMDYSHLFVDPSQLSFNEDALKKMDQIVQWGETYGVHILLDLHTLPELNPTDSGVTPWRSDDRLKLWVTVFDQLAQRYQDISPEKLSFNLYNEPQDVTEDVYLSDVKTVYDVIRETDVDRPIFIDGLDWSSVPIEGLADWKDPYLVASPHFYQPFLATHYLASWVDGADEFPVPTYPTMNIQRFLYGSYQKEFSKPFRLYGEFPEGTQVKFYLSHVSNSANLVISTDQERLLDQVFKSGPGEGEWKEVIYNQEWDIYQNRYDTVYEMTLTKDAKQLTFEALEGDWISMNKIEILNPNWEGMRTLTPTGSDWGAPQAEIYFNLNGSYDESKSTLVQDDAYLEKNYMEPWKAYEERTGITVVACEFGVFKYTSHEVALKILAFDLKTYQKNGWGWALWNLADAFGIMDSDRADVDYEDYKGHKLDREMLNLLLKYSKE